MREAGRQRDGSVTRKARKDRKAAKNERLKIGFYKSGTSQIQFFI
jgi:hypothetical protein